MPAWWAPEALNFGTKLVGGLLGGGKSDQQKLAERQQDFNEQKYRDEQALDVRDRNQRLGSDAYKNPMKAALLNKMMGGVGVETGGMGLPSGAMTYAKPAPIDPMRERMMQKFAPQSVISKVRAAMQAGPAAFSRFVASHPDTMRAYQDLMSAGGGRPGGV